MDVDEDASRDDAGQFLKMQIVQRLKSLKIIQLQTITPCLNLLLLLCQQPARALKSLCRPSRRKFHSLHVNFQSAPKHSRKGTMHISMLSYDKPSYAANGLFLGDAKLVLDAEGFHGLERK